MSLPLRWSPPPLSLLGQHSETNLGHHQSHSPYPCGLDLSVAMRSPFLLSCQEHTYIARWRDPSMKTQLSMCVCILSPSPSSPHPLSFLFSLLRLPTPIYLLATSSSFPSFLLSVFLPLTTSGSASNPKRRQPCWVTPVNQTYIGTTVLHHLPGMGKVVPMMRKLTILDRVRDLFLAVQHDSFFYPLGAQGLPSESYFPLLLAMKKD